MRNDCVPLAVMTMSCVVPELCPVIVRRPGPAMVASAMSGLVVYTAVAPGISIVAVS
jgi:hypothetical protein